MKKKKGIMNGMKPVPSNIDKSQSRLISVLTRKVNFLRVVVYLLLTVFAIATFWVIASSRSSSDLDSPVGPSSFKPKAALFLSPNVARYNIGEEFRINILMNTGGNNVVATAAHLSYNADSLKATGIDLTGSNFQFTAEKEINHKNGKIKITLGKPTPGVNSQRAQVATVTFVALAPISPQSYNIYFDFTKGSAEYSTVILDDKKGTNILSSAQGANIYVVE